jgi:hypothetical protein
MSLLAAGYIGIVFALKYSRQHNGVLSFCVQKGEYNAATSRVSLKNNRGQ